MMKEELSISVDIKWNRLRIYKMTLNALGNPKFIQLLVNPKTMEVAICPCNSEMRNDQTHRIYKRKLDTDYAYVIHSKSFVAKLCEVIGEFEYCTYKLAGKILPANNVAIFSLKTLQKVEF